MIRELVFAWAWRRILTTPPDFLIGPEGNPYMKRWYITPWSHYDRSNPPPWIKLTGWLPSIYLHHILHDDEDRALHDHPWASCSWVLWGCYWEVLFAWQRSRQRWFIQPGQQVRVFRPQGSITFRRATTAHRLVLDKNPGRSESIPAISLFFTGPVVRGWGFHCPKGWVPWRQFVAASNRGSVGKGCE